VLGYEANAALGASESLLELGIDSLLAMELRNALVSDFAMPISAMVAFDHPTVASLSDHLLELLADLELRETLQAAAQRRASEPEKFLEIEL
jgi:acyl carrier protein